MSFGWRPSLAERGCARSAEARQEGATAAIAEVAAARVTERGGRADDKRSETSMEDRKKEGYF